MSMRSCVSAQMVRGEIARGQDLNNHLQMNGRGNAVDNEIRGNDGKVRRTQALLLNDVTQFTGLKNLDDIVWDNMVCHISSFGFLHRNVRSTILD